MLRISTPEYGRIQRAEVDEKLLRRLQVFDEKHSKASNETVFDWNNIHYVRALNHVGVIQVPGLIVEILPKIDTSTVDVSSPFKQDSAQRSLAQSNLLYMLSLTRNIPARDKDLASLRLQKMPLLEALIMIFVEQLKGELKKGVEHSYLHKEENSKYLKGKLLISQHLKHNIAHKERVFVGYDDFLSDTWLNRILKAACNRLLTIVKMSRTQQRLREALMYFYDVSDCIIEEHHFNNVHLNRNTERFSTLLDFCKVILTQASPTVSSGKMNTFSLLFPMETLFEEFVARFICRYHDNFSLKRSMVHVQAKHMKKWLLRSENGAGKFRLKPDIVIDKLPQGRKLIIDTKWKRLKSNIEDSKNGVSQADIYQLYAYANRYDSPDNVLLYPMVGGVTPKSYTHYDDKEKKIRIETVDLNYDLFRNRNKLSSDLYRMMYDVVN